METKFKLISELETGDVITSTSPFWIHDWVVVDSPLEGYVAFVSSDNRESGIHLMPIHNSFVFVRS